MATMQGGQFFVFHSEHLKQMGPHNPS